MVISLRKRSQLALVASLTLLVAVLALCVDRAHNGDVYLQLFTGRFITQHGFVAHDPFPTIAQGQPWLNQQWLSEVIFYRVSQVIGITGLTVLYAFLLAAPLAALLWACSRRGTVMAILATIFYFPGLLAVIHPRAAGFTVVAFSTLVLLTMAAMRPGRRSPWPLVAIAALFLPWANLHGGFVAGFLLLGTVTAGLTIDRLRTPERTPNWGRIVALGAVAISGVAVATLGTPLGTSMWDYVFSFDNPAIALGTQEWQPALFTWPALLYLGLAIICAVWVWARSTAPRRITPLLVSIVFVAFAAYSIRNIAFIGPAVAMQIAWSARPTGRLRVRVPVAIAGGAAAVALLLWFTVLGPADTPKSLSPRTVDYALAHPPVEGRIAAYAGVGSYMLWKQPGTRVVLDGWLEHFSPQQLRDNYGILRGHPGTQGRARRLNVGAVIAHLPVGIRALERNGFVPVFTGPDGTYLMRSDLVSRSLR